MKSKNLILPMMAFICAIGMAFATVTSDQQARDYVQLEDGSWLDIDEQNCEMGIEDCQAQLGVGGPIYQIYDEEDLGTPKSSTSEDPFIVNPN